MRSFDEKFDDARDRTAAGMPRSLALGLILIVLGTGAAYYWNQFAVSLAPGKKAKAAPAAAPAEPGHGHLTRQ